MTVERTLEDLIALGLYPPKKQTSSGDINNITLLGDSYKEEDITATPLMVSSKSLTLESVPRDPLKVSIVFQNGIEQFSNIDFVVSTNIVSWNQLAMELLLEVGDRFKVRYHPLPLT